MKQNFESARDWFELAAQQNDAYALTFLGIMHRDGQAVDRDPAAALSYFEQATRHSFLNTTSSLAFFQAGQTFEAFADSLGLSADAAKARAIYQYRKGFINKDARAALQRLGVSHEIPTIGGWGEIQDPNGDCRIDAEKGPAGDTAIRITVPAGEHDIYSQQKLYGRRLAAPRVMQDVHGDFVAEVWITADWELGQARPVSRSGGAATYRTDARGAGLLVYASDHEYVRPRANALSTCGQRHGKRLRAADL